MHKSLLLHLSHRYVVQKGERAKLVICKWKTLFKTRSSRFKPLSLCSCVCARKSIQEKKYVCKKTFYKCANLIARIHILICRCTNLSATSRFWCRCVSVFCTIFTAAIVAKHVSVRVSWFVIRRIGFVHLQWRIREGVTVVFVFVGERKKSTSLQLLSVASNLLIHMCGYSLQLQIPLSQTLSCFAPKLPSYVCPSSTFVSMFAMMSMSVLVISGTIPWTMARHRLNPSRNMLTERLVSVQCVWSESDRCLCSVCVCVCVCVCVWERDQRSSSCTRRSGAGRCASTQTQTS